MTEAFNKELFEKMPIIGIMRHFPEQQLGPVLQAFVSAGFTTLEITMNSDNATQTISSLKAEWGERLNIGAGTVCTMKDLDTALEAGAQFIVSPIVRKKIIRACVKKGIPVFPGALTPTEIYSAWNWGATMVKVFPAGRLGPGYIKDILEPLKDIKLIPTGGINPHNFIDYLTMGASGAGMASALFPKEMIVDGKWEELRSFYGHIVQQYAQYKSEIKRDA